MEKKILLFIFTLLLFILFLPSNFGYNNFSDVCQIEKNICGDNKTNISEKQFCIYFFYSYTCPHCRAIEPYINEVVKKYPAVKLKNFEISQNTTNRIKLENMYTNYAVKNEDRGVPTVFIGDTVLIGEEKIRNGLEEKIKYYINNNITPPCPENYIVIKGSDQQPTELTIFTIITGGLIDSINPCAIGVLVIFITFMLSMKLPKRKIILFGGIYILCVYIAYFVAGIGILSFLKIISFFYIIQIFVILFLLIFAALSFYDAYKAYTKKGNYILAIPKGAKASLEKLMIRSTLPSAMILGFLVALVELPCSGAIYWGILDLLAISTTFYVGILYLLLYNFLFVSPLIILFYLLLKGKEINLLEKSETFTIKYLLGVFMIILAIIIAFSSFQIPKFTLDLKISEIEFFIIASMCYTFLFFTFAFLRQTVIKILNLKFYCAVCYSVTITWSILAILFFLNVNVPKILLAGLIGMSIVGVWTEIYKLYKDKNLLWIFHLLWINFGIVIFYSIFANNIEIFLIGLIIIYAMDGYLLLTYKKEVEKEKKENKIIEGEKKNFKERLEERLKHCCGD